MDSSGNFECVWELDLLNWFWFNFENKFGYVTWIWFYDIIYGSSENKIWIQTLL